jgi:hypothetical protein
VISRRKAILTAIASLFVPRRWAWAAPVELEPVYDPEECVLDYAIETLAKLKRERIRFGCFERFTDTEAWELIDGKWHPSPSESYVFDILFGAHSLDEETFREEFGNVPPLPPLAFKRPPAPPAKASRHEHALTGCKLLRVVISVRKNVRIGVHRHRNIAVAHSGLHRLHG